MVATHSLAARKRCTRARSWGSITGRGLLAATLLALLAFDATADICKYADAVGNIHYSNVAPDKSWRKISCANGDEPQRKVGGGSPTARPAVSTPGFPRIDSETQKGRDDVRRKVLADELASEEKLLVEARAAYADGAPQPQPEERTDAEKYRQRIARLRQAVGLHEKNIEALKKEIANIK
jgi:hypothetical protein